MELKNAKCPNCGATVKVNPGASVAVCMYCQSEYQVEEAIAQYNIAHQDVKEQKIEGKVNVGTQIVQNQTIINNVTRPRKFLTVAKAMDVSVYKDLRYDLVDRRLVDNGTKYEYVFERDNKYSNDRELSDIERQIDNDFEQICNSDIKLAKDKKARNATIVGLVFLLFIPGIGWCILITTGIVVLISNGVSKSKYKKKNIKLIEHIKTLKNQWLEVASRKGLID